eukprot:gnl/TRDRNA2_/TRDRNA2_170845_c1_seq3.p1 gnl/TRDRNA2_/TRDRNA2_170845_c1~~gnl/TRDRNA2_/TRDRNA2_170845_c1_seq3.p1  ORF type:complete len:183 (-),score=31.08 gnl/TRDRNA2_/TRDRNA2_170845_c1_seq3:208-756(-)
MLMCCCWRREEQLGGENGWCSDGAVAEDGVRVQRVKLLQEQNEQGSSASQRRSRDESSSSTKKKMSYVRSLAEQNECPNVAYVASAALNAKDKLKEAGRCGRRQRSSKEVSGGEVMPRASPCQWHGGREGGWRDTAVKKMGLKKNANSEGPQDSKDPLLMLPEGTSSEPAVYGADNDYWKKR